MTQPPGRLHDAITLNGMLAVNGRIRRHSNVDGLSPSTWN